MKTKTAYHARTEAQRIKSLEFETRSRFESFSRLLKEPKWTSSELKMWHQRCFGSDKWNSDTFPSLYDKAFPLLRKGRGMRLPRVRAHLSAKDIDDLNPLGRALLAFVWKQGDLQTFGHLVEGLIGSKRVREPLESAVMFQFGRHLRSPLSEPIFDQHTFRAFELLRGNVPRFKTFPRRASSACLVPTSEVLADRSFAPKMQDQINYIKWWRATIQPKIRSGSSNSPSRRLEATGVMLWADRCLFSLGKYAKPLVAKRAGG
jgi:hypothetical protein